MVKSKTIITANQHALIRLPSEGLKIVELRSGGTISLGKFGSFDVDAILGYAFGQSFEILDRSNVKPVKSLAPGLEDGEGAEEVAEAEPETEGELSKADLTSFFSTNAENNQQIIDIGSKVQSLTNQEIDELKKSGASSNIGQQIIEKIIAGHGGFDKKTIFSQQKYLRRKQQKFLRRFTVEYIGSSQLLQYYIEKDLPRVLDLSEETLGLILNYGNVRPGGKYLLVDETGGVILYAMMERMNGEGTIVLAHENEHPNHIALRYSDYPEELINQMVKPINWLQFLEPENEKIDLEILSQEEIDALKPTKQVQYEKRLKRSQDINSVIDMVQAGNFDGFISVSTLHLPSLLPEVLPAIGGSRPIVLYSQFKELLLETQHSLSNDKRVLAPSIFETRVRPYQTIIGRLHPMMTMRGFGGYVLWGTRVLPQENITAVGRGVSKKKKEESVGVESETEKPKEEGKQEVEN
ncbi:adenine-N(1)--methyltransferase [Suhomyces tanzawaensis NRRL Y-17324]|uniref:tRNA (adenine(58)-N(1))-methyltransferase non-catalytic subunit TRM6 n=1 Tax=Suhomyces tanzawaensis NRRL Y-17324 TaxID=984487 RepID=A0A1E4SKL6_9ASCO|nr:adenine-N(1)--methyltransferase [Suhomyces tanzawaensis NRRL Y-17324]ODV79972.1 adenine-N(1)--methyltransferase [Suhomyces tanzawaensis NRRL Y-17324]